MVSLSPWGSGQASEASDRSFFALSSQGEGWSFFALPIGGEIEDDTPLPKWEIHWFQRPSRGERDVCSSLPVGETVIFTPLPWGRDVSVLPSRWERQSFSRLCPGGEIDCF